MKKMFDNGAALALGVAGLVAVAGRVARGSFNGSLRSQIQHFLDASEEEGEVDSSELADLIREIYLSDLVSKKNRARARQVLRTAEAEDYLDTGDGLDVLNFALGDLPE